MRLVLLTISIWGAILYLAVGACISASSFTADWAHWAAFSILIAWSIVLGFYSAYHIASFTLSIIDRRLSLLSHEAKGSPRVAILYLCKDDFKEQALKSCCSQQYRNFDVFVLDDSELQEEHRVIATFCLAQKTPPNLRMRRSRDGFKAGNINSVLDEVIEQYKYFCIVDADDVLPTNFLKNLVAIAEADNSIGFIQSAHTQYGECAFAKGVGANQRTHWNFFSPTRNFQGFQHFYGHGALFRSAAINKIGKIPEVISEDIAIALELYRCGYRGYYAQHVVCQEEVPRDTYRFVQRQKRVLLGTLQCLRLYLPQFLRSSNVPWVTKADLLASVSVVFLPLGLIAFLISYHGFLLLSNTQSPSILETILLGAEVPESPLSILELKLLLVIVLLSPLIYQIPNILRLGWKAVSQNANLLCLHISIIPQIVIWILKLVAGHKLEFIATGSRSFSKQSKKAIRFSQCLGFIAIVIGLFSVGATAIVFGMCVIIAPLLDSILQSRVGKVIAATPAFVLLLSIILVTSVASMPIAYAGNTEHW